jgi:hypothetical protein
MCENKLTEFFRIMNQINFNYAPLEAKHYNMTYLAKLAMIPDDNVRTSTVLGIVRGGVSNAMDVLSIDRIPHLQHKKLKALFDDIATICVG